MKYFISLPVFIVVLLWGCVSVCSANSLKIENISLAEPNGTDKTIGITFDISWQNSWRNFINHDAVWVFVKYSKDAGATWSHAILKTSGTNPSGFSTGSGTGIEIVVPTEKSGCFIRRSLAGAGPVDADSVKIIWDWNANGLVLSDAVRIKIFGIEMAYVPQGAFYAGDNAASSSSLKQGSSDDDPWYVQNENAISVQNVASNGYYYVSGGNSGEGSTGSAFTIPANFPKGYAAFYVMKYEISQGQYRDFLNSLSYAQQINRIAAISAGNFMYSDNTQNTPQKRNGIKCQTAPSNPSPGTYQCDLNNNSTYNESSDGEWIACNYLSWMDLAAYADWSGLRPITGLEFEKICRGGQAAVNGEYAWGNAAMEAATSSLSNSGTSSETPNQGNCNYSVCSPDGPYRSGSYADSTSTRTNAGAGYYGVMELSGNLWERCVTIGNANGRSFTGTHGDGALSSDGNATNPDWPGHDGESPGEVTLAAGSGFRSGSWSDNTALLCVSNRANAALTDASRSHSGGSRCARTAP
jgi:formylglycine-generating enzyme required for sulfatase activity